MDVKEDTSLHIITRHRRYSRKTGHPSEVTIEIKNRFSKTVRGEIEFPGTEIETIQFSVLPGGIFSKMREFSRE